MPKAKWFLSRGESPIARVGLALTAVFVAATAATALWSVQSQRDAVAAARREQIQAAQATLQQVTESLLADGDVSSLRLLMANAGRAYHLTRCDVVLPDGKVIASAEPSKITARRVPEEWPSGPAVEPAMFTVTGSAVAASAPLKITGRGSARLELAGNVETLSAASIDGPAGVGAIGAAALVSLLFVYRSLRAKLRGVGAIREALLAADAGETHLPALAVGHDFGPEAAAWNRMIAARERLEAQVAVARARDTRADRRANKGDLEGAFDAMSQGLLLVDERLRAQFVNGAAAAFLRGKREDVLGADVTGMIQDEQVVKAIAEVAAGRSRRRTTVEVKRTDAQSNTVGVLRFSVRPVRREDSAAAMVVIEDVTQQRAADEARNSFVAQATHELRTPLTNIRLYVESAIEDGEADPELRSKALNVINQEARRLEGIVSEMLSVSEIEAGSLKLHRDDVRLDALFADLQNDFAAQAEDKKIQLKLNLPPKLPAIQADREKLTLALHNVVGNALKYTPAGGQVTVNVEVTAQHLRVEVADSGIGISPEDQQRIFDKFYRARDPRVGKITGTGLGLTLAREVIRLHGGDVTVDSQIDKGSTFTITCPVKLEGV